MLGAILSGSISKIAGGSDKSTEKALRMPVQDPRSKIRGCSSLDLGSWIPRRLSAVRSLPPRHSRWNRGLGSNSFLATLGTLSSVLPVLVFSISRCRRGVQSGLRGSSAIRTPDLRGRIRGPDSARFKRFKLESLHKTDVGLMAKTPKS